MPDKSQNIFINYKFNTAEVERATATLNRANQASNILQSTSQKAGATISRGFQQGQRSIYSMELELQRLQTQIKLATDPTKFAALSNEYKKLDTQIKQLNKTAFETPKAIGQTTKATQSLASQFGNLYTAARLFLTAGLVRETFNIILNMTSLKGEIEGVERAFKRAFPNSVIVLKNLREATHGTVNDLELMKRTLQATNLGVAIEQLPILFEFAAARAQQTGESVDYLVDSIVRGIGRKSVLVLDNLGISTTRLKEQFDGASIASKSVGEVTKGVAEIARQELEKMGGYAETAKTSVDRLRTSWQGLGQDIAENSNFQGFVDFLNGSIDGLRIWVKGIQGATIENARLVGAQDAERVVNSKAFKELADNQQQKIDFIQQEINSRVQLIGRYNDNITALKEERKELGNSHANLARVDAILAQVEALKQNKFILASTILALKEYRDELSKVNDETGQELLTISKLQEQLKGLKEQREEQTFVGDTAELDRLQREIILLEDRILKISDNIAWQKQWDHSKEMSALQTANETEQLKKFSDEIDKLTQKFAGGDISFSTGELLNPDRGATLNFDNLEADIQEIADIIETTQFEELGIRIRLFFNGEGLDSPSQLQQEINSMISGALENTFDTTVQFAKAATTAEANELRVRLDQTRDFYAQQISLAGDNSKAQKQLRDREARETAKLREQIATAEKKARRNQVLIDIAAGIAKALATYTWPYSLIPAAAVAAEGAIQLAIIDKTNTRGFAKGVIDLKGPGTETSDSIPAKLSKGESVMTAWETKNAGNVLKEIRAKKLDNRTLASLKNRDAITAVNAFDDKNIIKAIKDNRPPDVILESGIVYEGKQKSDTYRQKIRAKSIRL